MDPIHAIAFSPHPDDAELYCSGTLIMLARAGYRTGIVDLTRGELSTRGDLETRARETVAATRELGLSARTNLGIPDGGIENTVEHRLRIVRIVRAWRPSVVFIPYPVDRHPDHGNTATVVREAVFAAGLEKIATELDGKPQRPHRPAKIWQYMLSHDFHPTIIVDVSAAQETKDAAIRCYASQFWTGGDEADAPATYISSRAFLESLHGRSRRLGFLIGVEHGEGFEPLQALGLSAESLLTSLPV